MQPRGCPFFRVHSTNPQRIGVGAAPDGHHDRPGFGFAPRDTPANRLRMADQLLGYELLTRPRETALPADELDTSLGHVADVMCEYQRSLSLLERLRDLQVPRSPGSTSMRRLLPDGMRRRVTLAIEQLTDRLDRIATAQRRIRHILHDESIMHDEALATARINAELDAIMADPGGHMANAVTELQGVLAVLQGRTPGDAQAQQDRDTIRRLLNQAYGFDDATDRFRLLFGDTGSDLTAGFDLADGDGGQHCIGVLPTVLYELNHSAARLRAVQHRIAEPDSVHGNGDGQRRPIMLQRVRAHLHTEAPGFMRLLDRTASAAAAGNLSHPLLVGRDPNPGGIDPGTGQPRSLADQRFHGRNPGVDWHLPLSGVRYVSPQGVAVERHDRHGMRVMPLVVDYEHHNVAQGAVQRVAGLGDCTVAYDVQQPGAGVAATPVILEVVDNGHGVARVVRPEGMSADLFAYYHARLPGGAHGGAIAIGERYIVDFEGPLLATVAPRAYQAAVHPRPAVPGVVPGLRRPRHLACEAVYATIVDGPQWSDGVVIGAGVGQRPLPDGAPATVGYRYIIDYRITEPSLGHGMLDNQPSVDNCVFHLREDRRRHAPPPIFAAGGAPIAALDHAPTRENPFQYMNRLYSELQAAEAKQARFFEAVGLSEAQVEKLMAPIKALQADIDIVLTAEKRAARSGQRLQGLQAEVEALRGTFPAGLEAAQQQQRERFAGFSRSWRGQRHSVLRSVWESNGLPAAGFADGFADMQACLVGLQREHSLVLLGQSAQAANVAAGRPARAGELGLLDAQRCFVLGARPVVDADGHVTVAGLRLVVAERAFSAGAIRDEHEITSGTDGECADNTQERGNKEREVISCSSLRNDINQRFVAAALNEVVADASDIDNAVARAEAVLINGRAALDNDAIKAAVRKYIQEQLPRLRPVEAAIRAVVPQAVLDGAAVRAIADAAVLAAQADIAPVTAIANAVQAARGVVPAGPMQAALQDIIEEAVRNSISADARHNYCELVVNYNPVFQSLFEGLDGVHSVGQARAALAAEVRPGNSAGAPFSAEGDTSAPFGHRLVAQEQRQLERAITQMERLLVSLRFDGSALTEAVHDEQKANFEQGCTELRLRIQAVRDVCAQQNKFRYMDAEGQARFRVEATAAYDGLFEDPAVDQVANQLLNLQWVKVVDPANPDSTALTAQKEAIKPVFELSMRRVMTHARAVTTQRLEMAKRPQAKFLRATFDLEDTSRVSMTRSDPERAKQGRLVMGVMARRMNRKSVELISPEKVRQVRGELKAMQAGARRAMRAAAAA